MYDDRDPDHPPSRTPGTPARVVSVIHSPPYTHEDLGLLLGLEQYESSLCGGCNQPRAVAWHSEMDGEYEPQSFVCHACTAKRAGNDKAIYTIPVAIRDPAKGPLPPFVLGKTTTED